MFQLLDDNRKIIATAVTRAGIERYVESNPIEAAFIVTPNGTVEPL